MNYNSPSEMWEDFTAYAAKVKDNPRYITEYHGKDGDTKNKPLERPLTIEGFIEFVWQERDFGIYDYFYSDNERYKPFSIVCTRVRNIIRGDQIEGGMVGRYNSSITQRLNGLVDKKEVDAKIEQPLFPDVTKNNGN